MLFSRPKFKPSTAVRFFNTETRQVETFEPIESKSVKMYSCGPTVYDYIHIGNLRAFFLADIIKRTLTWNGYTVKSVMNFTDFGHLTDDGDEGEDKIMKGLKREGKPITLEAMRELTDFYIDAFLADASALRLLPATKYTRASEYIEEQIALIQTLEAKGYTYETSDGVYFDISKFPAYGRLGKIDLEKLKAGARVETNNEKRHPADFAVWKKGELGWDSDWGKGFPGWHIECSAMAMTELGLEIDIHTGGIDLHSIHHNAEIAQCECVSEKRFVRYWLHNEFLQIDGGKIGKSLGNAINLNTLLDQGFSGDDYRYWLLMSHYRSPANFSLEGLTGAKQALTRLKRLVYEEYKNKAGTPDNTYLEKFSAFINDDLDTPRALAVLFDVIKDDSLDNKTKCATLKKMDEVLGIGLSEDTATGLASLGNLNQTEVPEEIKTLVEERELARIARNWDEADRVRELLKIKGYVVEDTPHGPKVGRLT